MSRKKEVKARRKSGEEVLGGQNALQLSSANGPVSFGRYVDSVENGVTIDALSLSRSAYFSFRVRPGGLTTNCST